MRGEGFAFDQFAAPGLAQELAVLDDDLAARNRHGRPAGDLEALEQLPILTRMKILLAMAMCHRAVLRS